MAKKKQYTYIDLFSGAGGFSVGFDKSGFKNLFSLDNEEAFCKTYRRNFPEHNLVTKNIEDVSKTEMDSLLGGNEVDVLVGGPPCQGFSIAGNIGRQFIDDPRNHLFKEFIRLVEITKPKFFIMENVARLYTHNKGKTRDEIISRFKAIGYKTEVKILNTADYGVPQLRRRTVFIGTNDLSSNIEFPSASAKRYTTVKEALAGLPALKSGQSSKSVLNHVAMNHTPQMLKKMKYVKENGGRQDIPVELRPQSGDVRKYIRYNRNKPSVTVTGDMRKIFHYSQNRALTVRELARLQSFDDTFVFESSSISQQQQVGNAVPPLLAEALAKKLAELLEKYDK